MIQVHVYFSGMVQGVGFRYTARDFAKRLGISGWVRNLSDGRVELLAEASEEAIDEFLKNIDEAFAGYIRDRRIEKEKAQGEIADFRIVH